MQSLSGSADRFDGGGGGSPRRPCLDREPRGGFITLSTMEASAVVCAAGGVRAGCVAGGAAVVQGPVGAARRVVVAPRAVASVKPDNQRSTHWKPELLTTTPILLYRPPRPP